MLIMSIFNKSKLFFISLALVFCCSSQAFAEEYYLRTPMRDSTYRAMLELGQEMLGLRDTFFPYRGEKDRLAMYRWAIAHLGIQENELPAPDDLHNKYLWPLRLGRDNNMGWKRISLPDISPVGTLEFMLYHQTYDPIEQNFISTIRVVPYVRGEIRPGMRILELGCGPGLFAAWVAKLCEIKGIRDVEIVAGDRNPAAVINAYDNAELNRVSDKIDFRCGDGLKVLKPGEKFDIIVWNELPTNAPLGGIVSRNTVDAGYRTQDAIISGVGGFLKENTGYFCFVGEGGVWADWIAYWALKYSLSSTQDRNNNNNTQNYRLSTIKKYSLVSIYNDIVINFVSNVGWLFEKYFSESDILQGLKNGSEKWEGYAPDFRRKITPIKDLEAALTLLDKDASEDMFRQIFNAIRQIQGDSSMDIWFVRNKEKITALFKDGSIGQAFLAVAEAYDKRTGFSIRTSLSEAARTQI